MSDDDKDIDIESDVSILLQLSDLLPAHIVPLENNTLLNGEGGGGF